MSALNLKKDDFQKEVLDHKGLVVVDFYAVWCGPCKTISPIIDELAKEVKEAKFVKVNVDENPDLASTYSIFSIPSFVFFKNGQVVLQFAGAMGKEGFLAKINEALSK